MCTPWMLDIRKRFLDPFLDGDQIVVEIGSGGGRWSQLLWHRCSYLYLVDGTEYGEKAIRSTFSIPSEVKFIICPDGKNLPINNQSVDFVFSFDTMVHFHNELLYNYLIEINRILKPGGHFTLHLAKSLGLRAPFFQYHSEEQVLTMLHNIGMEYAGESQIIYNEHHSGSILYLLRKS